VDDLRAVRPGQAHADRHPQQLGARPGRARPVRRRSRCRPGTSAPAQRTRSPGPPSWRGPQGRLTLWWRDFDRTGVLSSWSNSCSP